MRAFYQIGHERCSEQRSAAAAIQGGGPVDQKRPAADRRYILPPRTGFVTRLLVVS